MQRTMKALCVTMLALLASAARADGEQTELAPSGPGTEPVDTTRLDVQNLPPEAIHVTRDLYDRGLFFEAQLGATTFVGDARKVSHAGPRLAIGVGYEFARWFALVLQVDGSIHQTDNRPPPAHTSYQLIGGVAGARFSLPIDARFAVWAEGIVGVAWTSGDVLHALGFEHANKLGLNYGGELGFDFHLRSRHHSLGLLAGARRLPSLERDGVTVAPYGAGYLRYVY